MEQRIYQGSLAQQGLDELCLVDTSVRIPHILVLALATRGSDKLGLPKSAIRSTSRTRSFYMYLQ